jgi:hypothetical protein
VTSSRTSAAYCLLIGVLFAAQAAYMFAGFERLWYEELAEGMRNPFWLDHRAVYDGASTNISWYAMVLVTCKAFGFSPYAGKYVRLALHLLFLICTGLLLARWLGVRRAWLPLIATALSPTLLYFNSLAFPCGIDVQLCPLVLWLTLRAAEGDARAGRSAAFEFALGFVSMVASLAYPTFLTYLPIVVAALIFYRVRRRDGRLPRSLGRTAAWTCAGFAAPLAIALAYLRDIRPFVADPIANHTGVFRGGGNAVTLDPVEFVHGIAAVLRDLFIRGSSYYFAVPRVEFSGPIGVAAAWGILIAAIVVAWNRRAWRAPLVFAGLLCLSAIAVPSLSRQLPGLRRSTGVISGAYMLSAVVWAVPGDVGLRRAAVWAGKLACLLLVVHHVLAFMPNLRYLQNETRKMNDPWFYAYGAPHVSIRTWAREWVLHGKALACPAQPCRFSEIYPAVAGYLESNGVEEPAVMAVDPRSGEIRRLNIRLNEPFGVDGTLRFRPST